MVEWSDRGGGKRERNTTSLSLAPSFYWPRHTPVWGAIDEDAITIPSTTHTALLSLSLCVHACGFKVCVETVKRQRLLQN